MLANRKHVRGPDWSEDEVRETVRAYFEMLDKESRGEPYNKSEQNALLRQKLASRSKGAVELKHQNISSVLYELGLPWINGYKPARNAQGLLRQIVIDHLSSASSNVPEIVIRMASASNRKPDDQITSRKWSEVLTDRPDAQETVLTPPNGNRKLRLPRKLDFAEVEDRNRELGCAGEEFVVWFERTRLRESGCPDLAQYVRWVSRELGDGLGYDVESRNLDGSTIYIEVKTTNGGASTPFLISQNELDMSEELGEDFRLYRVYSFSSEPKLFILSGSMRHALKLQPQTYRAYMS